MKTKPNSTTLHIWIAENGDDQARKAICTYAKITGATLCRILKGSMPRFEIRYRIFKLTGVKLSDLDDFPDIAKQNAS